jgi:hypothetical protein
MKFILCIMEYDIPTMLGCKVFVFKIILVSGRRSELFMEHRWYRLKSAPSRSKKQMCYQAKLQEFYSCVLSSTWAHIMFFCRISVIVL